MSPLKAVGYVRASTDIQAGRGVSLDVQAEKIRAMAVVQGAELSGLIVDGGESAKSLNRPGMALRVAFLDHPIGEAVGGAKVGVDRDRRQAFVTEFSDSQKHVTFAHRGLALDAGSNAFQAQ